MMKYLTHWNGSKNKSDWIDFKAGNELRGGLLADSKLF